MICYRDRQFCEFYTECRTGEYCISALTEEVQKKANEWWDSTPSTEIKGTAPIMIFSSKPLCFEERGE
jgi:hypothetical protein